MTFLRWRAIYGRHRLWVLAVPVLLVMAIAAALLLAPWTGGRHAELVSHGHRYSLEVVSTPAAQHLGLGGRASLPLSSGMLFAFAGDGTRCFWMKNMRFPLDIVWLDAAARVTAVESNLPPSSYPHMFCHPGRYVVELNAGQARVAGITPGEQLGF